MQGVDPALEGEKGRRPVLTLLREEKVGIRLRKVSNKSKLSSLNEVRFKGFNLAPKEKTCYTRTSPNFNFLALHGNLGDE
ncbi:hypothetical protein [uncultured Dialister sp.]|uniref:hypothetical protein n=1 Tax=uncultured Dialister sp. TaxID=278064 RepID=UPI00265F8A0D|nr:hypothetical protein [uncultured Dialister sp.]